jgi:hypothetical protein
VNYWEISLTISAKPVAVGAVSQRLIQTGERSSLADAHRGDGKRFVVRADERLTAFLELEAAIHRAIRRPSRKRTREGSNEVL